MSDNGDKLEEHCTGEETCADEEFRGAKLIGDAKVQLRDGVAVFDSDLRKRLQERGVIKDGEQHWVGDDADYSPKSIPVEEYGTSADIHRYSSKYNPLEDT